MKYRRLSTEELHKLEAEFIRFLAANTITGDDWEKLKSQKTDKAEELLNLFSDIVFDKVLDDLKYLEFKSIADLKIFYCGQEKMVLMGLRVIGESDIDFRTPLPAEELINRLNASKAKLEVYSAEKAYSKDRKMELFQMMEQGCLIADGKLFEVLRDLKKGG